MISKPTCALPTDQMPSPGAGQQILVRRALYRLQDRGKCLHLAFQCLPDGQQLIISCLRAFSALCPDQMPSPV